MSDQELAHKLRDASGAIRRCLDHEEFLLKAADRMDELVIQKDGAYAERNKLVALLCSLYQSSLEQVGGEGGEPGWNWVVVIALPTGQATWHIHDDELGLFDHVPRDQGAAWDGHTTDEKYVRVADAAKGKTNGTCHVREFQPEKEPRNWTAACGRFRPCQLHKDVEPPKGDREEYCEANSEHDTGCILTKGHVKKHYSGGTRTDSSWPNEGSKE